MKWFSRQKDNHTAPPVPPELKPYYEEREPEGRDWRWLIPRIIIGLLVLALIVLLIIWAAGGFSGGKKQTPAKTPGTSQAPSTKAPNESKSGTSGQQGQANQPKTSPNNTGRQAPPSGKGGQNLSNTGPGDTIAAFAGAVAAGAGLHQIYIRRRKTA